MNSRCRRFDLLLFAVLAQSDAAIIAVLARSCTLCCRWLSIDRDRRTMAGRCFIQINSRICDAGDAVLAIVLGVFRV